MSLMIGSFLKHDFFNNFFVTLEFSRLPQNLFNCQGLKDLKKRMGKISDVKFFCSSLFYQILLIWNMSSNSLMNIFRFLLINQFISI